MTSAFSWQNSISLHPASFCTPRPNLPLSYSRCFLTSYFCISVPYNEKDIFFWVLVLKGLVGLHRTIQLQLLQCYWSGHRLGLHDIEWFALETSRDHSVIFHPSTAFQTLLLTMMATSFLLRDSLPTVVDILVI